MNALRKFALTVHKNYLAASGKKRSLKANMLAALIRPENLLDLFAFLWDGRANSLPRYWQCHFSMLCSSQNIGNTAQFVGSVGDAFSAICCLQIFRFTSSKPSKSAIASDEKFIHLRTNSFVRCCLKVFLWISHDVQKTILTMLSQRCIMYVQIRLVLS